MPGKRSIIRPSAPKGIVIRNCSPNNLKYGILNYEFKIRAKRMDFRFLVHLAAQGAANIHPLGQRATACCDRADAMWRTRRSGEKAYARSASLRSTLPVSQTLASARPPLLHGYSQIGCVLWVMRAFG